MSDREDLTEPSDSVEDREGGDTEEIPAGVVILQSTDLLKGNREVWIEHLGEMYCLRTTARGKLYLTK